jgi:hypothetical protein
LLSSASAAFSDICFDGNAASAYLACESESLVGWEIHGVLVDCDAQQVSFLPDLQSPEISHEQIM